MRTKDEIIGHLFDDVKKAKELCTLEHLTDVSLLEVVIDLRDMFDTRLGILFNLLLDWKDKS